MTPEAWQILLIIISPIGALLGAYAFRLKKQAEIEAEKARADADQANARVNQIEADTKIRLQEADSKAKADNVLSTMVQQLQTERMDWLKELQTKERRDEANYRLLAATQRDNTQMLLTEIQNHNTHMTEIVTQQNQAAAESRRLTQERLDLLGDQFKHIVTEMATVLQNASVETGMVMARQVAIQSLATDLFPFPDSEDPRWKTVFLTPLKPDVGLFKRPYYDDQSRLQKPCAKVKPEGQRVQIITGQLQDWYIVMKENGEKCWGYLPVHAVKISDPLPALVH